jgi:hypothetical protein
MVSVGSLGAVIEVKNFRMLGDFSGNGGMGCG